MVDPPDTHSNVVVYVSAVTTVRSIGIHYRGQRYVYTLLTSVCCTYVSLLKCHPVEIRMENFLKTTFLLQISPLYFSNLDSRIRAFCKNRKSNAHMSLHVTRMGMMPIFTHIRRPGKDGQTGLATPLEYFLPSPLCCHESCQRKQFVFPQ